MALVKDAMNPTTAIGRRSLRSLAVLATGTMSTFVITGMVLGKGWDEIAEGLNPLNGKRFLSFQVNGDWIGVGGQIRAIAQFLASAIAAPDQLIANDRYNNPLIRFITGRGAPGTDIAGGLIEVVSGGKINAQPYEELDGPIDWLKQSATAHAPFALQGFLEGEQSLTIGTALVGARTSPETPFDRRRAAQIQAMQQLGFEGDPQNLDRDQKAAVDELVPEEVKMEVADLRRNRRDKMQALTDALDAVDEEIDSAVQLAAAEGPGKPFRDRLSSLNGSRGDRKEQERNGIQHQDALRFFEEAEPAQAGFDRALEAYYTMANDPRLENVLGDYDFRLREQLQAEWETVHPQYVDRVLTHVRRNEHPLAKELREDREALREYFSIRTALLNHSSMSERSRDIWQRFLEGGPRDKKAIRLQYPSFIQELEGRVRRIQDILREEENIDRLLVKWEYSGSPRTEAGKEAFLEAVAP